MWVVGLDYNNFVSVDRSNQFPPKESTAGLELIVGHGSGCSCPYAFAHNGSVYIFFLYKDCLMCRVAEDPGAKEGGLYTDYAAGFVKQPVYFIDGVIANIEAEMKESETQTKDTNASDNKRGVFVVPTGKSSSRFTATRAVVGQRVCAVAMQASKVRVFYKHSNGELKAAYFDGAEWVLEDSIA